MTLIISRRCLCAIAALLCIVAVHDGSALTVRNIGLEQLTRESSIIIRGTVVSSYAQWEGNNIFTYTTILVGERLKGDDDATTIVVKHMGGTVGDVSAVVDGTPSLRPNEEVVLFLVSWQGNYWIHSIVLGKFSVRQEENGPVAYNDLNNIGLIDPATGREVTEPNRKENHFPLQVFLERVRSYSAR